MKMGSFMATELKTLFPVNGMNGAIRVKNHFNMNGLADGEQRVYDITGKLLKSYYMNNGTGVEYIFHDKNMKSHGRTENAMGPLRFLTRRENWFQQTSILKA